MPYYPPPCELKVKLGREDISWRISETNVDIVEDPVHCSHVDFTEIEGVRRLPQLRDLGKILEVMADRYRDYVLVAVRSSPFHRNPTRVSPSDYCACLFF